MSKAWSRSVGAFYNHFSSRNAKAFAFRLQHEVDLARSNIYNDLREKIGQPDLTVAKLRSSLELVGNKKWLAQLKFADELWRAHLSLSLAERIFK